MRDSYLHYIGGAVSGLCEVSITHPVDVMKTRVQSGMSWIPARSEGLRAYYKGFVPRIGGVVPMRLTFWGVQGSVDNFYRRRSGVYGGNEWWKRTGVVGFWSGFAQTLIDCPIENRKTRLITSASSNAAGNTAGNAAESLVHRNFRGFMPNLYRNVGFAWVFFGSHRFYEEFCLARMEREESDIERMGVSFGGATVGCILTQPFDCIKTFRQRGGVLGNSGGTVGTVAMMRVFGVKNLWRGMLGRLLTSGIGMCVGFYVYNSVLVKI